MSYKKSLIILIFLLLLPSISNASYKYIKVTTTKQSDMLWQIKSKLNNMGLTMISMQTNKNYLVYSGPYKNEKSAKSALKLIKTTFKSAKIIGQDKVDKKIIKKEIKQSISVEDENTTEVQISIQEDEMKEIIIDDYNGFFIGASLGFAYTPFERNTQSGVVIISSAPTAYNLSYSIETGYEYRNGVFISLKYLKAYSSDISTDNLLASLNYRFELDNDIKPFLGVLSGQSLLNRKFAPLDNPKSANIQSESFVIGFEIGASYDVYEEIETYISYQYILMDHAAILEPSTGVSRLAHNSLHNIQIGLRF